MKTKSVQINILNHQIESIKLGEDSQMKEKLEYAISLIKNLGILFKEASPEVKIKLIGSIFPEKIIFDGENYRTKSYNQVLDYIFQDTKQLQDKKK